MNKALGLAAKEKFSDLASIKADSLWFEML
jgi:hypothetical protein